MIVIARVHDRGRCSPLVSVRQARLRLFAKLVQHPVREVLAPLALASPSPRSWIAAVKNDLDWLLTTKQFSGMGAATFHDWVQTFTRLIVYGSIDKAVLKDLVQLLIA